MADINTLSAELRDRAGKGAARSTRRAGRVPGVIYGDKKDPVLISVEPRELDRVLRRPGFFAKLLDLTVDGGTHRVLPRDAQLHPVSEKALHVDFMRVGAHTRITVGIPVHFINQEKSAGLKRGGILNVVRHEIELVCNADNIPDHLTVDLSGTDIGDSIHISAVTLPEGTKPTIDRDFTIASVAPPSVVREEQQAAAAAAAAAAGAPAADAAAAPAAAGTAAAPAAGAKPAAPAKS